MDSTSKTKITLAGRVFDIPCLPFKQNREIVPAVSYALRAITRANPPTSEPINITAMDYMYTAVYSAVSYVDPKVTRDEFNTWGISFGELTDALTGIAIQTGILVKSEGGDAGEQKARAK